jgi:hypothetical protein
LLLKEELWKPERGMQSARRGSRRGLEGEGLTQGRMYIKDSRRNTEGGGDVCKLLEEGAQMAILKHCRFSYK